LFSWQFAFQYLRVLVDRDWNDIILDRRSSGIRLVLFKQRFVRYGGRFN